MKQRLAKVMAAAGIASRRKCEDLIFAGRVKLNGEPCLVPQTLVDSEKDKIVVDDSTVANVEEKVYFIVNKPKGLHCTADEDRAPQRVIDLFGNLPYRLFTVGRLDRDTTGLIIVTNDGHYCNKVIHPSANIQKEYLAKTQEAVEEVHLEAIRRGCRVDGAFVKPVRATKMRRGTVMVTVTDGRKREVREMLAQAGLKVLSLTRVRIGNLRLNTIPEGHYRPMTEKERELVFQ